MTITRAWLNDVMRAYKKTSLLRTAIELGVFDALAGGARTSAEIACRTGAHPRGIRILLDALAASGMVDARSGGYRLVPGAGELLVSTSPSYYGEMAKVMASDYEWESLGRLTQAVRHGGSVEEENAETPGFGYWETFASFASAVTLPTARVMADMLEPWAADRPDLDVLDVACGHGLYGFGVARRFPQATLACLDWDNVLRITEKHAAEQQVRERTRFIAGDMFEVDYQGPYDLILVTNVLHHFSPDRATELLRRAARALKPGGRVAVVSMVRTGPPAEDPEAHMFSVLMLAWTDMGEVHSDEVHHDVLTAAGFTDVQRRQVPDLAFHVFVAALADPADGATRP
ncbi:class I SAM-dependent methyltransferase [Actinomadura chokoriensis]|uniref:Methyltransferase n=1 Tax=Actinomadura chokoriensis TaxID=454156 RepID=A0ABV4R4W9_9ACTN